MEFKLDCVNGEIYYIQKDMTLEQFIEWIGSKQFIIIRDGKIAIQTSNISGILAMTIGREEISSDGRIVAKEV